LFIILMEKVNKIVKNVTFITVEDT
jgi:hypothetical protein